MRSAGVSHLKEGGIFFVMAMLSNRLNSWRPAFFTTLHPMAFRSYAFKSDNGWSDRQFNHCRLMVAGCLMVFVAFAPRWGYAQSDWRDAMKAINPDIAVPFDIDERSVIAAGIRKISGQHIDLYTDIPSNPAIDELVDVFDLAIQPWCDHFNIDPELAKRWKIRVFLIDDVKNPNRFRQTGLLPVDLPDFPTGFQRDHNIWIFHQPGKYYTRHLLIHEGTHSFMQWFLKGYGAPWYSEGVAELLGVHRWSDQQLTIGYRLTDRNESEYWGRVKGIIDDRDAGRAMTLTDILNIPTNAFREVRFYGWSWAACEFFSKHEKTKTAFAKLKRNVTMEPQSFSLEFSAAIKNHWVQLERDWELFIAEIDYGYQVDRGRLSIAKPGAKSDFQVQSDRSWQVTTILVKQGDRIRLTGTGEFQVGMSDDGTPWPCQSNGITIEYYRGQPLGMLQAGILDHRAKTARDQIQGLLNPHSIGIESEFTATSDGILCLRINESPAKLDDNLGGLEVDVEKLK